MTSRRKFSLFISSTYEDLKEERQALLGVALENGFIPVGMEQFHGAPTDQWTVITRIIDECDFYLLVVGGRYGSIDASVDMSYTEKEYNYAKTKGIPVLVLIKNSSSITEDKKDSGANKYELMKRLDEFRQKIKNDNNTVDFFSDLSDLKYKATATLKNATEYADFNSGWVRYTDVAEVINEEVKGRSLVSTELSVQQQKALEELKGMLTKFGNRLTEIENNQLSRGEMPEATKEDIKNLLRVENGTLIIGGGNDLDITVGQDDVGYVPVESAMLLVYAASNNGQIIKMRTLGSPVQVFVAGKQFMANNSHREAARWVEALDRLVSWGWVKPTGYKREIFELTGTGYQKAEWLKECMQINTDNEPLEEMKEFER